MRTPVVLLTRPRAEAEALAEELRAEGWTPLLWPLLEIVPTGERPDLAGARAVLFTSANAAQLAAPAALPVYCVGDRTAAAARDAGFGDVRSAAGDAEALADLVAASLRPEAGPLVFARGEAVAGGLAGRLRAAGFDVRESVLYRAEPARAAPEAVATALAAGRVDAAAFYSPRTAAVFTELAPAFRAGLTSTVAAAISERAAAPLRRLGFAEIRVADRPDGAAMRRLLAMLAESVRRDLSV